MISQVKLITVRPISPISSECEYIWIYKTNENLWNGSKSIVWTRYPSDISSILEKAFISGVDQTFISKRNRIDFIKFVEEYIEGEKRQRPIRRRYFKASMTNNGISEDETAHDERLSFPLSINGKTSTTIDTTYHGSLFITDWLLLFTQGKFDVTFDNIFPVLINGLIHEGRYQPNKTVKEIIDALNLVKYENFNKNNRKKMKMLQDCCAKLYTKQCFLFRIVNTALRDDDRTKLETLGPYCYLVYNYIGRDINENLSIRRCISQIIHRSISQSIIVYRGDNIYHEKIEEYKQAIGKKKYFKWLPFVSTSLKRYVAETFGLNVLYIIELGRYLSYDQFTYLNKNTFIQCEQEILLRPGARFRIIKLEFDHISQRHLIYIKIIPSYISYLR
ncbi:unnamed protein product [Rotaria sp. Silwood1]|nr:unnamed protein product [Rotaria sp. Silwood1]CAF5001636.1 unnamed protein product [Rotaria sp. Silwood1]